MKSCRIEELGPTAAPTLLLDPARDNGDVAPPAVLWLHGRTAWKEVDPGRFLRLMRSGIAVVAPDLPGHGDRYDPELQSTEHVLDVIRMMLQELDELVTDAIKSLGADPMRVGIGGMSAGGMVAIARMTRPHDFLCAVLEATTGSWSHQRLRPMFAHCDDATIRAIDPLEHIDAWTPIPLLAVHSKADAWVDWVGQSKFLDAVESLGPPELVERMIFEQTGAEHEHVGFGLHSADVKERERDFFARHLSTSVS